MKPCRLYLLLVLILLGGCETISYYSQAAQGQWALWRLRQPIEQLVVDSSLDPVLKQRLQQVQMIRQFASRQLALPDNNSYRYYSDLQRRYVVWNVFATEEFSVSPRHWCFPIAGCVSYRGYFSEPAARGYADKLNRQGYDTYVGGVAAYSTLGWFADPVLNTFINYDELRLAGLIFHELAHQQVYIAGDTMFNESFASAVAFAGIERWLTYQQRPEQVSVYVDSQSISRDFITLLLQAREQLAQLYQLDLPEQEKRARKQQFFNDIVAVRYPAFKEKWYAIAEKREPKARRHIVNQVDQYDQWLSVSLNNAKLSTLASYYQWQPAFQYLLAEAKGDLTVFYQRVKSLAKLDYELRQQRLEVLAEQALSATLNR